MKGGTKLILLHPSSAHKPAATAHHRLCILAILSFSAVAFFLTLLFANPHPLSTAPAASRLPPDIADALLHYAAAANATDRMSSAELGSVSAVLRFCSSPCNLLVFGLTAETLLWRALNRGGRTVFLDENEFLISKWDSSVAGFEGYDVQYTTTVAGFRKLISAAKSHRKTDCRPVQNLLFSDCRLGINDLPNHLYSIPWDVIIIDGPSGYSPKSPGRTSAIFTAAVLARSKGSGSGAVGVMGKTDVFVHDFKREVERVTGEEFLCRENLVEVKGSLAHFVVAEMDPGSSDFCTDGGHAGKLKSNQNFPVALV